MQAPEHSDVLQRLSSTAERLSYSADWNPSQLGDSEMRIARDGRWYHQGGLIERSTLVQLFSRLLRREGDQYFLVTPVEKLTIEVEDAPFVSVEVKAQDEEGQQVLYVTTNLGDTRCRLAPSILYMLKEIPILKSHRLMCRLATTLQFCCSAVIFICWLTLRRSVLWMGKSCWAYAVRVSFTR